MVHKRIHNGLGEPPGVFGLEAAISIKQLRHFRYIRLRLLQDGHVQEGQHLAQVVVGTEATQHSW